MNPTISRRQAIVAGALSLAGGAAFGQAAAYPTRPVTLVVPFPPGGGTDVAARLIAQKLQQRWGQSVIVENRAGAAGVLGADVVAKARPDGYTLLAGNIGTQSINPLLYKRLPYNPDKAFEPISLVAELPMLLLATPGLPAKDLKEFLALAKAAPDKFTFASSGAGGSPHLSAELLQSMAGIRLLHVPYKGGGPAMADLMAGHVDLLFATVLEGAGHVKSGRLRTLGISSSTRSPVLPDVPTIAEAGVPGFVAGSWLGLLAPAGTPGPIVQKIAADVKAALADPATVGFIADQGAVARGTTPEAFGALIDADRKRYAQLIEERGIHAE